MSGKAVHEYRIEPQTPAGVPLLHGPCHHDPDGGNCHHAVFHKPGEPCDHEPHFWTKTAPYTAELGGIIAMARHFEANDEVHLIPKHMPQRYYCNGIYMPIVPVPSDYAARVNYRSRPLKPTFTLAGSIDEYGLPRPTLGIENHWPGYHCDTCGGVCRISPAVIGGRAAMPPPFVFTDDPKYDGHSTWWRVRNFLFGGWDA